VSRLIALMWREWREFRSVAGGCAILALAASLFTQHYSFDYAQPAEAAGKFAPFLAAFFPAIVAADIVSSDARSRRLETLAMLPVGAHIIWWAKLLFVVLSGAAFYFYVLLLQVAIPVAVGNVREGMFVFKHFGGRGFVALPIGYLIGFAVLFFSTLRFRSFVSMAFGAGLVGIIYSLLALPDLEPIRDSGLWKVGLFVATCLALLIASRAAFVAGRVSTGERLRPVLVGVATLLCLLVPTYVHAAVRSTTYYDLEAGDRDVRLQDLRVSPNGKYLSVTAHRWGRPDAQRTWVIRVDDGALFTWTAPGQRAVAWTRDGLLRMRPGRGQGSDRTGYWFHPETGERQPMPSTPRERMASDVRSDAVPEWGAIRENGGRSGRRRWVQIERTGDEFDVGHWTRTLPREGEILEVVDGHYVHHDLPAGMSRVLCATSVTGYWLTGYRVGGPRGSWRSSLSRSRRYLANLDEGWVSVLEIESGRTVWGPVRIGGRYRHDPSVIGWARAPNGMDLLELKAAQEHRLILPESGREFSLDHLTIGPEVAITQVQPISADRIAVMRIDRDEERCEILLLDGEGRIVRTLYSPETVAASQGKGTHR